MQAAIVTVPAGRVHRERKCADTRETVKALRFFLHVTGVDKGPPMAGQIRFFLLK